MKQQLVSGLLLLAAVSCPSLAEGVSALGAGSFSSRLSGGPFGTYRAFEGLPQSQQSDIQLFANFLDTRCRCVPTNKGLVISASSISDALLTKDFNVVLRHGEKQVQVEDVFFYERNDNSLKVPEGTESEFFGLLREGLNELWISATDNKGYGLSVAFEIRYCTKRH